MEQANVKDTSKDSVNNDESDARGTISFGAVRHVDEGGAVEDDGQEPRGGKGGVVKGESKGGTVNDEGKEAKVRQCCR